ncbi:hypothetical protein QE404_002691 [Chryseobacterium camelliae]|uniref:Uncharacterized protein n=1 Tax=Chryseobacterium camelliae TaxID=1265445 RepID=A0ABU0TKF9_9FLAO|nr:hypothetical protein [Chryseobacterium camelliae]
MNIKNIVGEKLSEVILNIYQLKDVKLEVQENKTEFEGDFTIVTFPLVKQLKKKSGKYCCGVRGGPDYTNRSAGKL